MIIVVFLAALVISFSIHIYFLFLYAIKREKRYLNFFLVTTNSNVIIAIILIVIALKYPDVVKEADFTYVFWIISGILMIIMLMLKIRIFRRIYERSKDPENYHYNFFGKRVLHSSVVKLTDIFLFFLSMPIFLLAGSYFIARLINLFMYGNI